MLEFLGFILFTSSSMLADLPDDAALAQYTPSANVVAVDRSGEELFLLGEKDRELLPLDEVPEHVYGAFLSAEDSRFFEHAGFDPMAMARATVQNAGASQGRRLIGGSTITQQLSKGVFVGNKRTVRRKLREAVVAVRWEREVGKDRVLELYLNEIYLGRGVFGIARAAEAYFGKSAAELTVAEAATLAALVKAPSSLARERNRERLEARRNWVISQMVDNGYATALQGLVERRKAMKFVDRAVDPFIDSYYEDLVRRELVDLLGRDRVAQGGLTVEVALDKRVQSQLDDTFKRGLLALDSIYPFRGSFKLNATRRLTAPKGWALAEVESIKSDSFSVLMDNGERCNIRYGRTGGPSFDRSATRIMKNGEYVFVEPQGRSGCALRQVPEISAGSVVVDRLSGEIRGAVGGFDYGVSQFNRSIQARRQPGSTIKPLTYYAALDLGYRPDERIKDEALEIELPNGRVWTPQNADRKFLGELSLESALYRSRNVPTLTLAQELGFRTYWRYATHLGVTRLMPREWTVVLGAAQTTVVDMAGAYATMFNEGDVTPAYAVARITAGDSVIFDLSQDICVDCRPNSRFMRRQREATTSRLRPRPETTEALRGILRKVVTQGTAARYGQQMPAGTLGKTGTTNDFKDAWFIGETDVSEGNPMIMAVFVGHDVPKPITRQGTGGRIAAPMFADFWTEFMKPEPEAQPEAVEQVVTYRVISALNFRSARGLNSRVLGVLPQNAVLTDVACDGRWCEGTYKDQRGFASNRYLKATSGVAQVVDDRFVELRSYMRSTGGTYKVAPEPEAQLARSSTSQQAPAKNPAKNKAIVRAQAPKVTRAKKVSKSSKKKKK